MGKQKTMQDDIEELRDLVREAHGVMGDLTRTMREVRALITEVEKVSQTVFEERMNETVVAGLAAYQGVISEAIEGATDAVYQRFDTIASVLLQRSDDKPGIEELVMGWSLLTPEQIAVITEGL